MAAFTTALTEFSTSGNSRTFTSASHTVLVPKLVIQKRRVPSGNQVISENTLSVVHLTNDAEGNPLDQKVTIAMSVRYPTNGQSADVDAALVIARDLLASDEFTSSVTTQNFIA